MVGKCNFNPKEERNLYIHFCMIERIRDKLCFVVLTIYYQLQVDNRLAGKIVYV